MVSILNDLIHLRCLITMKKINRFKIRWKIKEKPRKDKEKAQPIT